MPPCSPCTDLPSPASVRPSRSSRKPSNTPQATSSSQCLLVESAHRSRTTQRAQALRKSRSARVVFVLEINVHVLALQSTQAREPRVELLIGVLGLAQPRVCEGTGAHHRRGCILVGFRDGQRASAVSEQRIDVVIEPGRIAKFKRGWYP